MGIDQLIFIFKEYTFCLEMIFIFHRLFSFLDFLINEFAGPGVLYGELSFSNNYKSSQEVAEWVIQVGIPVGTHPA